MRKLFERISGRVSKTDEHRPASLELGYVPVHVTDRDGFGRTHYEARYDHHCIDHIGKDVDKEGKQRTIHVVRTDGTIEYHDWNWKAINDRPPGEPKP